MNKFLPDRIYIHQSLKNMVSFRLQESLANEMNLRGLLYVLFSTIRLKGEVNFFISRGFLEVFMVIGAVP